MILGSNLHLGIEFHGAEVARGGCGGVSRAVPRDRG